MSDLRPVIVVHDLDDRWRWQVIVGGELVAAGDEYSHDAAVLAAQAHPKSRRAEELEIMRSRGEI